MFFGIGEYKIVKAGHTRGFLALLSSRFLIILILYWHNRNYENGDYWLHLPILNFVLS